MTNTTKPPRLTLGTLAFLIAIASGYHAWLTTTITARLDRVENKVDQLLLDRPQHLAMRSIEPTPGAD